MRNLFVITAIGAAVGLAGCGKHEAKYSNGAVTVSGSGDHFSMTGANGEKVEIGSGSTAKLPSFLPLYPGGVVKSSVLGAGNTGTGGLVVFHAGAAPADIIGFYKQKAAAAGMAATMTAEEGPTSVYVATNKTSKQTIEVAATKANDGSDVQLTWSGPSK